MLSHIVLALFKSYNIDYGGIWLIEKTSLHVCCFHTRSLCFMGSNEVFFLL